LAAAGLGALAALALPPLTLLPVLAVSIPGLLALIDGAPRRRAAFRRGLVFGTAHHMVGIYWITNAIMIRAAEFWWAVPFAVPLLAAVLALFIAVPCAVARGAAPGWPRALVLAAAWVAGDLARQFALTGFPWNPLGSATEMPGWLGLAFMQPAAWVGVHGLTFAVLLVAASFGLGRRAALGGLLALAAWGGAGAARLMQPGPPATSLSAVIVQGNVSEADAMTHAGNRAWVNGVFDKHLALTRAGMHQLANQSGADAPAIVVWPETASPYWLAEDTAARHAIAEAASPALATFAGAPRQDAARKIYNSLIVVMPDATVGGFYDKFHLVPYGEYFPSYLPIRLGEGWDFGPGLRTLHVAGLPPIGPLICFEAAFPAQVALRGAQRPSMLVNLTSDSWFGDSAGPRQHLAAARMRAVEEGLPVVRAANTGISAFIDAHGKVVASLGLDQAGTLVAKIPGFLPPTPAARLGLVPPVAISILGLIFGAFLTWKRPLSRY
jgi:apolipoprotein N-acyltransferase